jgi:ligand-binding SRPBCC domain-containing protein
MAHFEFSSIIAAPRKDVFDYVSDVSNLGQIMSTDYKIEGTMPFTKMKQGAEYEVRLTRAGISVLWGIVIEELVPGERVRDRQSHGPFSLFVHTQKFEDHGAGTLLTDFIEYDVPFGLFGKLADDLFIRRDLAKVFSHRHDKINRFFVQAPPPPSAASKK